MKISIRVWAIGYFFFLAIPTFAAVRYVDVNSASPTPPYITWATAATSIQDAIDVAVPGDEVSVTNGIYQIGGRVVAGALTNRVVVDKAITIQSINGPAMTEIRGNPTLDANAVRCVYLTNDAILAGFTLSQGGTLIDGDPDQDQSGGAVWCTAQSVVVSNCFFTGNIANATGGGAFGGTLNNCVFSSNHVSTYGAGASVAVLNNCTLSNNVVDGSSGGGGGAYNCTLSNCTLAGNTVNDGGGGGAVGGMLNNCTVTDNHAKFGAGVSLATLNNCILRSNSAIFNGGGSQNSTLNNCLLIGNSAGNGGGAARGTLNDCLLTNNSASVGGGTFNCAVNQSTFVSNTASSSGGAVFLGTLNNCLLKQNSSLADGGGAQSATLNDCAIFANHAEINGGGANSSTLNNCTLSANSATDGGGVNDSVLANCVVYYNTASSGSNWFNGTLNYSCTVPLPADGVGNITSAPVFVDQAAGDLRLQSNSPCINSGKNDYVVNSSDFGGDPRIVAYTVDIGAYEFQSPGSILSYAWAQQYGLPTDGTADYADSDGDGMNNWQEWHASTIPTDASSVLKLLSPVSNSPGVIVTWQSVSNVTYFLDRSVDLSAQPAFGNVESNIVGQAGTTTYTDTNAIGAGPFFYRVGVQ
jgi:hypothetical protein